MHALLQWSMKDLQAFHNLVKKWKEFPYIKTRLWNLGQFILQITSSKFKQAFWQVSSASKIQCGWHQWWNQSIRIPEIE